MRTVKSPRDSGVGTHRVRRRELQQLLKYNTGLRGARRAKVDGFPCLRGPGVAISLDGCATTDLGRRKHAMGRFAVLMYHRIESNRCPVADAEEQPWAVPMDRFASQIEGLRSRGRVGVSMGQIHEQLCAGRPVPPEWVGITFDDGNESDFEHALPMLVERGFRATFFVCGERVDAKGGLSRAMIREMHGAGMHVGSHAMTHRFLPVLAAGAEEDELRASRECLEAIVGAAVDHFAPPGGRWSARTRDTLRRLSYRAVSTSTFGYNDASRAVFAYRRLPVVRSTSERRFDAMIRGDRTRLLGSYARARSLVLVRALAGETVYGRMRAVRTGTPE